MSLLASIILCDPTEKIASNYYISTEKINEFKQRMNDILDLPVLNPVVIQLINEIKDYNTPKDKVEMAHPGIQVFISQCDETNN